MSPQVQGDVSPDRRGLSPSTGRCVPEYREICPRIDGDCPRVQEYVSPGTERWRCAPGLREICPRIEEDVSPGTGRCVPGLTGIVPGYREMVMCPRTEGDVYPVTGRCVPGLREMCRLPQHADTHSHLRIHVHKFLLCRKA